MQVVRSQFSASYHDEHSTQSGTRQAAVLHKQARRTERDQAAKGSWPLCCAVHTTLCSTMRMVSSQQRACTLQVRRSRVWRCLLLAAGQQIIAGCASCCYMCCCLWHLTEHSMLTCFRQRPPDAMTGCHPAREDGRCAAQSRAASIQQEIEPAASARLQIFGCGQAVIVRSMGT
jgi:hypothetical protein